MGDGMVFDQTLGFLSIEQPATIQLDLHRNTRGTGCTTFHKMGHLSFGNIGLCFVAASCQACQSPWINSLVSLVDRGTRDHNLFAILANVSQNVSQNVAWFSYSSSTDFSVSQKDAAPTWFVCSGLVWVSYRLKWDVADVATVLPWWLQSAQIPARPHDLHTFPRAKMYIICIILIAISIYLYIYNIYV